MNRMFRVVWSDSRQAFIVANEKTKSKGKPSSTRNTVASAVALALAAMAGQSAMAAPCPVADGGGVISVTTADINTTCNLGTGHSLTVSNIGQIAAEPAVTVNGIASSIVNNGDILGAFVGIDIFGSMTGGITNNTGGRIASGSTFGIRLTNGSVGGGITNDVGGSITGGSAIALFSGSSVSGGITNRGTIVGGNFGIGLDASSLTGGIINSGTIQQGLIGISLANGSTADSITNEATGQILGNTGINLYSYATVGSITNDGNIISNNTGIYLSNNTSVTGDITNNGDISGGGVGIALNSNSSIGGGIVNSGTIAGSSTAAIYLNSNSTAASITNSGTISGYGYGISLQNGSTVTGAITNNAGGTISGSSSGSAGIYLSSGSSVGSIVNSGTITGRYSGTLISDSTVGSITNQSIGTISGTSGTGLQLWRSTINGNITNNGNISGGYVGIGLHSSSSVGGIVNNGTIAGSSTAAIYLDNSTAASITNSGTISGYGYGISLENGATVTGAITNNAGGTISGSNSAGIYLSSGSSVGSIVNSGTITGRYSGVGIYNSMVGSITNHATGTISGASGSGLRILGSTINGDITNNGTISGTNTGLSLTDYSTVNGSIANSGTISGKYNGVYLSNVTMTGGITNALGGLIQDVAANPSTAANGLSINDSTIGSISNSGTIRASTGDGSGLRIGLLVANNSTVSGAITNNASGTISGGGTGLLVESTSTVGSISNAGTITGGTGLAINIQGTVTNGITNTGTINGAVALNAATLNLNGTAGSITGAVTGGAGSTVNVNGTFTTANTFAVDNFRIASGGVLNMGHGITPTTAFTNAGTLAVAAGTTATITGDYTQDATGMVRTGVTNDTTYGKLVVTGTATLPANAKIDVNVANPNFAFTATDMAGVITAGTLASDGTFAITDNSALFNFTASKNGNAVDLALATVPTVPTEPTVPTGDSGAVRDSITNSGNTSAMGAATVLDGLVAAFASGGTGNADMDTVIAALGALSTQQQVSNAVSATLPLMTGGMAQAASANLNGVNRVVQAQQDANVGLSSGDGFVSDGKIWFKPLGSWADQNNAHGTSGYKADTYGIVLGADGDLSKTTSLGAAFAYARSDVNSNSALQNAKVDSYQFVLYGSSSLAADTELNWQAGYGYNQNKGSRTIAFMNRVASTDYSSDSIHFGVGIGRILKMNEQTSFTPSIRADYTSIRDKGYTETGAGALNLVVKGKTTEEFVLALDGKLAHKLSDNSSVTGNLGVGYDVNAKQNSITASFAGGGAAFTTKGIKPSATLVRGGLGYVTHTAGGTEITARYDVEARSGYTGQTASVKVRIPF